MTRRIRPALALLTLTIASVTPTSPPATAAPVPDSPVMEGAATPGVESGTEFAPIIGDPAHSDVQYATVGETAVRLARVAVGLPPVLGRP